MKNLQDLRNEQEDEVARYRAVAEDAINQFIRTNELIIGALLAGSVARGDARTGPFGLYIDLVIVAEERKDINLTDVFGPNIEPYTPKHCIKFKCTGLAIELTTRKDLLDIRTRWESEIYARQESIVLYDKTGFLQKWKAEAFTITKEQKRDRALAYYFRSQYLVGQYRVEKWKHREAWVQLAQIGNEAVECYCSFLYCINNLFIPRKDWLAYLTYGLSEKMPDHEHVLEEIYTIIPTEEDVDRRFIGFTDVLSWMTSVCKTNGWIP